jgi:hypothetical protein
LASSGGRSTRAYRQVRAFVFATFPRVCGKCGDPVNMALAEINPRHPRAPSLGHKRPVALGGALTDVDNCQIEHYGCNASASARVRNGLAPLSTPHPPPATPASGSTPSRAW